MPNWGGLDAFCLDTAKSKREQDLKKKKDFQAGTHSYQKVYTPER